MATTSRITLALLSRLMETVRGKWLRTSNLKVTLSSSFTPRDVIQQMTDQRRNGSLALNKTLRSEQTFTFVNFGGWVFIRFLYLNPVCHSHWKHYLQRILEHYTQVKSGNLQSREVRVLHRKVNNILTGLHISATYCTKFQRLLKNRRSVIPSLIGADESPCNGDDSGGDDMEIDMVDGAYIGKADILISKEPNRISPAVFKDKDFTRQSSSSNVAKEMGSNIPGFENCKLRFGSPEVCGSSSSGTRKRKYSD